MAHPRLVTRPFRLPCLPASSLVCIAQSVLEHSSRTRVACLPAFFLLSCWAGHHLLHAYRLSRRQKMTAARCHHPASARLHLNIIGSNQHVPVIADPCKASAIAVLHHAEDPLDFITRDARHHPDSLASPLVRLLQAAIRAFRAARLTAGRRRVNG
ncbi:hypothetical protein B0T11DRAFT_288570 [Plectosphaerella cucumerina]|uniref:Uncharacterized protein n=1 Tax=Plectosphaerella cucumerina TaxID=40658 RepID=A0A8K0TBF7_9PEZI|nr:hypothetical protein B0T11DRAFT_288570 [Plectosphaerella cucumerina]